MRIWLRSALMASLLLAVPAMARASDVQPMSNQDMAYFQTKNVFHSGLRDSHVVALTFDDGPNLNTPAVLDALKAMHVKATFFIVGKMARQYPAILARIAAEGHLLANHSDTHPLLGRKYVRNPELLVDQIRQVDNLIRPLMPKGTQLYFRAPYGSWRASHAAVLNSDPVLKSYIGPIYWDIGGQVTMSSDGYILSAADWDCWRNHWDADTCAKGYMREIRRKDGGVVLLHCIGSQSPRLVGDIVPALIEEGYRFVRLDEVQEYKQYEIAPTPRVSLASAARSESEIR